LNYQATVQKEIMERFPDWKNLTDPQLRREFQFLAIRGPGNMSSDLIEEVKQIQNLKRSIFLHYE